MANTYFKFKQFTITQSRSAMKVGTDGVLIGAWLKPMAFSRILDVGTGTGLIALMLAQKSKALIDAVEIEEGAAKDAEMNFSMSCWGDRIRLYNKSFQEFSIDCECRYDLIVSNPPFFNSGPESEDLTRAVARHSNDLNLSDLISDSKNLLRYDGKIALILPVELRKELLLAINKYGLWIEKETKVKPKFSKPTNRILFLLSNLRNVAREVTEIAIEKEDRHCYSKEFIELTKDYYLNSK